MYVCLRLGGDQRDGKADCRHRGVDVQRRCQGVRRWIAVRSVPSYRPRDHRRQCTHRRDTTSIVLAEVLSACRGCERRLPAANIKCAASVVQMTHGPRFAG
jgi:hypothetical protein